jgi:hypothetical protein
MLIFIIVAIFLLQYKSVYSKEVPIDPAEIYLNIKQKQEMKLKLLYIWEV